MEQPSTIYIYYTLHKHTRIKIFGNGVILFRRKPTGFIKTQAAIPSPVRLSKVPAQVLCWPGGGGVSQKYYKALLHCSWGWGRPVHRHAPASPLPQEWGVDELCRPKLVRPSICNPTLLTKTHTDKYKGSNPTPVKWKEVHVKNFPILSFKQQSLCIPKGWQTFRNKCDESIKGSIFLKTLQIELLSPKLALPDFLFYPSSPTIPNLRACLPKTHKGIFLGLLCGGADRNTLVASFRSDKIWTWLKMHQGETFQNCAHGLFKSGCLLLNDSIMTCG